MNDEENKLLATELIAIYVAIFLSNCFACFQHYEHGQRIKALEQQVQSVKEAK